MKKVSIVGSLNMDYVLKVNDLPLKGETIFSTSYNLYSGGKGANQAASIGRLGIPVDIIGKVGKDDNGKKLINDLLNSNVNVDRIIVDTDINTGAAFITVDENGNNTIVVVPGANNSLKVDEIKAGFKRTMINDIVVVQFEIPKDVVLYIINFAKDTGRQIVLNFSPATDVDWALLNKVDYLILNESEINHLTGHGSVQINYMEQVKQLRKYFKNNIILTLGKHGSICASRDNDFIEVPPFPVESIDATGAGDAFIGGFVLGMVENRTIKECTLLGNAAGALATMKIGAQNSLPLKEELEIFLESHNLEENDK